MQYYKIYLKRYFLEFKGASGPGIRLNTLFVSVHCSVRTKKLINIKVRKKYFYSVERTVVKYYDSM